MIVDWKYKRRDESDSSDSIWITMNPSTRAWWCEDCSRLTVVPGIICVVFAVCRSRHGHFRNLRNRISHEIRNETAVPHSFVKERGEYSYKLDRLCSGQSIHYSCLTSLKSLPWYTYWTFNSRVLAQAITRD